jgi:hypothetical protein
MQPSQSRDIKDYILRNLMVGLLGLSGETVAHPRRIGD